ncbi:hypothetical protein ACQ86N_12790 [Puia sp. P3]|uniref:hypothetical protein n=1 Tax=Puia sp. P3 TaxID=3423952 RepID=UPI003D6713D3
MDINTGELIKRLRRENHSASANKTALRVAKSFAFVERLVKVGLRVGGVFGPSAMGRLSAAVRRVVPDFPLWTRELTGPVKVPASSGSGAVYFPTCITRMMGKDISERDTIVDVFLRVARRAGIQLFVPSSMTGVCCGQAFSSKGFADAYKWKVNETVEKIWEWTRQGAIPVVLDISSCHSIAAYQPALSDGRESGAFRQTADPGQPGVRG